MTTSKISYFSLYGEEENVADPEFLHIEAISNRVEALSGRVGAHAHRQLFQIVFLTTGSARLGLDQRLEFIHAPVAVCVPSGIVHSFTLSEDCSGWILTGSDLLIGEERYRQSRELVEVLFESPLILRFQDNLNSSKQIAWTLDRMLQEFSSSGIGRRPMMEWMLQLILVEMRRQLDKEFTANTTADRNRDLFIDFCRLLEQHYREHWPVSRYAGALGTGQARLNRLCQRYGGRSAVDLVQSRLTLEAQRHLIYTPSSAAQIAQQLGFDDPAYFSRFFKRRTGMTPGAYREAQSSGSTAAD